MTAAGDAGAVDPAALAAQISASLKAGLEQSPHVVACSPILIGVLTTYLDSAAPMIAAAMERDRLAADLAAARADAAKARDDALEEAARIATDQANEDRKLLKDGLIDYEPAGAAILTSVNIAKAIRAARTAGGSDGRS